MSDDSLLGPEHPDYEKNILDQLEKDESDFRQYVLAIGATGPVPENVSQLIYQTGIAFAHEAGIEPILCVGYVTNSAQRADYFAAQDIWARLGPKNRTRLKDEFPLLSAALALLFGLKMGEGSMGDVADQIFEKWVDAAGGRSYYEGPTAGAAMFRVHGEVLKATLDAVLNGK